MNWIEVNGAVLRYDLSGIGPRTIVLVHEAGGSLESWDRVVALMAPQYRILRYDQRGFGMSEKATTLELDIMVNDLVGLLDALQIDPTCYLAGTAIGGTICLALAGAHPGRIAGVVATSPVTGGLPATAVTALQQRAALIEKEGMRAIADASLLRSYPPNLRHDAQQFTDYRARFLANEPQSFAALSRAFTTIDLSPVYSTITCPTLLVGCREDTIKPAQECAQIASLLPDGHYAEAASGHFIAVQSPDLFVHMLQTFLEQKNARH